MTLSIEESIQKLKAETIAQDWRLSPTRAEQLEAAFACLQQRFKNRKATHAMLVMAGSVLDYIKKKGGSPPETIDFLKEAMAHVVGLYEDLAYEPEKEGKIFQSLFTRFSKLKEKIKAQRKADVQQKPEEASAELPPSSVSGPNDFPGDDPVQSAAKAASVLENSPETTSGTDVQRLITDLKASLEKAGEVGTAIGQILGELLETSADGKNPTTPPATDKEPESASLSVAEHPCNPAPPSEPAPKKPPRQKIKDCPATELTIFTVSDAKIAILSSSISLARVVSNAKIKSYIKSSNVPLKDFAGFMQKVSSLVSGNLAKIKERKLKKLTLPIMVPQGLGLAETPDENADSLMVVSNGNWHGVLACSNIEKTPSIMIKFEKQKNGDIAGIGFSEDESGVQLIDSMSILRREGFLLMA